MKEMILIGLVILSQVSFSTISKKYFSPAEVEYESGITRAKETGELLTGIVRDYYPNGQLKIHVELLNGKQHGKEIWWFENGNKKHELQFKNGSHISTGYFWHENGEIAQIHGKDMIVGFYNNGKKQRVIIYENGKIIYSKEWNEDGNEKKYKGDG